MADSRKVAQVSPPTLVVQVSPDQALVTTNDDYYEVKKIKRPVSQATFAQLVRHDPMRAALYAHIPEVKQMIRDRLQVGEYLRSQDAFFVALYFSRDLPGRKELITQLAEIAPDRLNEGRDIGGGTPLHIVTGYSHYRAEPDLIKLFLDKKANPYQPCSKEDEATPFMYAAAKDDPILDAYLNHDAFKQLVIPANRDHAGRALCTANNATRITRLLNYFQTPELINVNAVYQNYGSSSPLHYVVRKGPEAVIALLAAPGLDLEVETSTKQNAVQIVEEEAKRCYDSKKESELNGVGKIVRYARLIKGLVQADAFSAALLLQLEDLRVHHIPSAVFIPQIWNSLQRSYKHDKKVDQAKLDQHKFLVDCYIDPAKGVQGIFDDAKHVNLSKLDELFKVGCDVGKKENQVPHQIKQLGTIRDKLRTEFDLALKRKQDETPEAKLAWVDSILTHDAICLARNSSGLKASGLRNHIMQARTILDGEREQQNRKRGDAVSARALIDFKRPQPSATAAVNAVPASKLEHKRA